MASMVPASEEAATTISQRRTSTVWESYTINCPADGGACTATCLECGRTLCAGSNNGTSHLRRHPTTRRCQQVAAERVELARRQPTSPPTTAAADPSPGGNVEDEDEEEKKYFTVDGIYIPDLYDKLIAEGLHNIEQSSGSAEHLSAASNYVPAVPPQVASSKMMRFKERQAKRQKTGSDAHRPDDESEHKAHDFNLRGKRTM